MKIIGLTGGIGSGKSTVGRFFKILGVPVFNSDERARWLIENDADLKNQITALFGPKAFENGNYNRAYIAKLIFNNPDLLAKINHLVHPFVKKDFDDWVKNQNGKYIIKEAAILFESGTYKDCHRIIFIGAPKIERVARVMRRDGLSEEAVEIRMKNQWPDEEKQKRSHFVIWNDNKTLLIPQLLELHDLFTQNALTDFTS